MAKNKTSVDFDESLVEQLRDGPEAQIEFIKAVIEENADMPQAILESIRLVAEARGFKNFASEAGVNRESLYKTLSPDGNPKLETLTKILDTLGLRLTVEPKELKAS